VPASPVPYPPGLSETPFSGQILEVRDASDPDAARHRPSQLFCGLVKLPDKESDLPFPRKLPLLFSDKQRDPSPRAFYRFCPAGVRGSCRERISTNPWMYSS